MRILQYNLGFSPYRSGGLTRYAYDLMKSQMDLGLQVYALYPGGTNLFKPKCSVTHEGMIKKIEVFELVNPMPVPLYYGIKSPYDMMDESCLDEQSFCGMLDRIMPDVMHVHTLMGLPKKYLSIVHDKNVRIVYTSHDYFGLCPKVNLINCENACCEGMNESRCVSCNKDAKPVWFLRIRNFKCLVPFKSIVRRMLR